jgi:hypothetical protein
LGSARRSGRIFRRFWNGENFSSDPESHWVNLFQQIGAGPWFRYFTGVVEVLGGMLVLILRTVFIGPATACVYHGGRGSDPRIRRWRARLQRLPCNLLHRSHGYRLDPLGAMILLFTGAR